MAGWFCAHLRPSRDGRPSATEGYFTFERVGNWAEGREEAQDIFLLQSLHYSIPFPSALFHASLHSDVMGEETMNRNASVMADAGIIPPSLPSSTLVTMGTGGAASFFGSSDVGTTTRRRRVRRARDRGRDQRWRRRGGGLNYSGDGREADSLARLLARSLSTAFLSRTTRGRNRLALSLSLSFGSFLFPPSFLSTTDRCVTGLLIAEMRPPDTIGEDTTPLALDS